MKKFLIAMLAAAVLMLGCTGGLPTSSDVVLPAHIQRIENIANELPGTNIKIIDYRDDGSTIWSWVDNPGMPESCDYVVVLGIVDKSTDSYIELFVFNVETAANPCQDAYKEYDKYLVVMEQRKLPKKGI
jgi:hypothetical protein